MVSDIQKVQNENYENILRILVIKCANSISIRDNKEGIDTFILSESIGIQKYAFKQKHFYNLYSAIAERFRDDFEKFDFETLPFWIADNPHIIFLTQLWKDYFSCEIDSIIAAEPSFAVKVVEMVVKEDLAWSNGSWIGGYLFERYAE